MTDTSPFTLGTKIARVEYHHGIPRRITAGYVAKVTPSGRFQIRYAHMKEGEMSDYVYEPKMLWDYSSQSNQWRGCKRAVKGWDRERDWQVWDAEVDALVEARKQYDRTAALLNQVQVKVIGMRATWEGVAPVVEKLAEVLGITPEGKE